VRSHGTGSEALIVYQEVWLAGHGGRNEAGAFTILDDEYGIVIGGLPGSGSTAHFNLKTFRVEGSRGGNLIQVTFFHQRQLGRVTSLHQDLACHVEGVGGTRLLRSRC
jgi:hypothetical protein